MDSLATAPVGAGESATTGSASPWVKRVAQAGIFFAAMPYIGVAALPSDTQPVAFVIAAIGVALLLARSRLHISPLAWPLVVMALLATVSFVLRGAFEDPGFIWLVRSYYGYASAPIIVTFFLYYLPVLRKEEIARAIDIALVVAFIGFLLNAFGQTEVVQHVVNRALFPGRVMAARGLPGFFAEPSRVSEQMAIFFFCYCLTGRLTTPRVVGLVVASLLAAAGQMFVIFAHIVLAYGGAAALLVVIRRVLSVRAVTRLVLAGVVVAGFLSFHELIAADLIRLGFPTRGITAISRIVRDGRRYIGQDTGMMDKVAGTLQAAATLVDNPVTFKLAAAAKDEYAATVTPTYSWLMRVLFESDTLRFQRRPNSALGIWIIEFGVIGLVAALAFVWLLLRRAARAPRAAQLPVLWATLFLIQVLFIKLSLANPSLWLLSALIWVSAVSGSSLRLRPSDRRSRGTGRGGGAPRQTNK